MCVLLVGGRILLERPSVLPPLPRTNPLLPLCDCRSSSPNFTHLAQKLPERSLSLGVAICHLSPVVPLTFKFQRVCLVSQVVLKDLPTCAQPQTTELQRPLANQQVTPDSRSSHLTGMLLLPVRARGAWGLPPSAPSRAISLLPNHYRGAFVLAVPRVRGSEATPVSYSNPPFPLSYLCHKRQSYIDAEDTVRL